MRGATSFRRENGCDQRRTMGPALPLDAIRRLIQRLVSWLWPKRAGLGRREAGLRR